YAAPAGHAIIAARLYVPGDWAGDSGRRAVAGIPGDRESATKPQLGTEIVQELITEGRCPPWVTGDEVYGRDARLRAFLEAQGTGYVLKIPCSFRVTLPSGQKVRADHAARLVPAPGDPPGTRWPRAAGCLVLPRRHLPAWSGLGALSGAVDQLGSRGGDLGLRDRSAAPGSDDVPGVGPDELADGHGEGAQVGPGRGQPAAVVMVADPDPGDVVRVVTDLPPAVPGLDPGVLAPVGVELATVIGPQAGPDPVGIDHPPGGRQQLDVVLRAERDRDVARHRDQGGVTLIRRHRPAPGHPLAQPVMRAVLPD